MGWKIEKGLIFEGIKSLCFPKMQELVFLPQKSGISPGFRGKIDEELAKFHFYEKF
jgi:hypothetical protein